MLTLADLDSMALIQINMAFRTAADTTICVLLAGLRSLTVINEGGAVFGNSA
jgi:hypothetical protein